MEAGMRSFGISLCLHVPIATLYRWFSRFRAERRVERHRGSGRPLATSQRADRRLVRLARLNRFAPSSALLNLWDEPVSGLTVRRRLRAAGLRPRRSLRRPQLSRRHRQLRLRWAMARCHFRDAQWARIIFSDESRFLLRPVDGRVRVWRSRQEAAWRHGVLETTAYGGGSVMVWGAICSDGRSPLMILRRTVTGISYRQLLAECLLPWAENLLGPRATHWRLQDDNAPPHRAAVVRDFLEESGIRRIDWPPQSPDLNPIEHLWDVLGRRVRQRQPPPQSIGQLAVALQEEWLAVPQMLILRLIHSMPNRINQVLVTRGGHTRY